MSANRIVGTVIEPENAIIKHVGDLNYTVVNASDNVIKNQWVVFNAEEGADSRLRGDVNEDNKVDISDVVAVINQMAGTASYRYADVNEDTKTDISDIVAVINIIAGN